MLVCKIWWVNCDKQHWKEEETGKNWKNSVGWKFPKYFCCDCSYRKIPKISSGAYIFQRPFLRGLFLEGAYVRSEICVSKSIGLDCSGKEIYHFCFVLLCIREQIPCTSPPGGLYSEGRFNGGFFALRFWGAYTWRGLFSEFYGMYVADNTDPVLGETNNFLCLL